MEMTLVLILLIVFFSAFVQGVSGFAFGMMMVSLLPFVMNSYYDILAYISILGVILLAAETIRYFRYIKWKLLFVPLLGVIIFELLSIWILKTFPDLSWERYLGVFLIALSLYLMLIQGRIPIRPTYRNGLIAGSLSGFLGGLFGVGGPPIVVYFLSVVKGEKYAYFATTQALFFFILVFDLGVRLSYGLYTKAVFGLVFPGIFAVLLGVYLGGKVLHHLNPQWFHRMVFLVMAFNGVVLMFF